MLTNYCLMFTFYIRVSFEVLDSHSAYLRAGEEYTSIWGFKITAEVVAKFFDDFQYSNQDTIVESLDTSGTHCFLDINKVSKLAPLMLSMSLTWPTFEISEAGEIIIPPREEFLLVCPDTFQNFPNKKHIKASCVGGDHIKVIEEKHRYFDIQCTKKVEHDLIKSGIECVPGGQVRVTEIYKMVYKLFDDKFIELFEICMDTEYEVPIYTKYVTQNSFADVDIRKPKSYIDQFALEFETFGHDCKAIASRVEGGLARIEDGECCHALKQLVNYRDIFPGVSQIASFTYVNTAPVWSTCHSENWDDVEYRVRALAKSSPNSLLVWTGILPFYRGIWKVVQDPGTKSSLAIVQVDFHDVWRIFVPWVYQLCTDICNQTDWMFGFQWGDETRGYTYCCTIKEFQEEFNIHIFEPHYESTLTHRSIMAVSKDAKMFSSFL